MNTLGDLRLNAAAFFLIVLIFLPALLGEWRGRKSGAAVPLTGIEFLAVRMRDESRKRRAIRAGLLAIIVLGLALLWSGPAVQLTAPILDTGQRTVQKNLMFAIDVSRSMSGPMEVPDAQERMAAFGQNTMGAGESESRYEAARQTVHDFIERFPDARIGLILFSTEPFLARWPTNETGNRFREVLEEELAGASQLRRFASLTNTDKALKLAEDVFSKQPNFGSGAVVHISDAEDELENMGMAIRSLREAGIRLYTIGVGISESVVEDLSREFSGDPGFRIFRADSEREMREAYQLVSTLEESPRYAENEKAYVSELRWLIAIVLILCAIAVFLILENNLHRMVVSQSRV